MSPTSTPHSIAPSLRTPAAAGLAAAIARDGITAHEDAVARLARATSVRDRAPTLALVLLDRSAPSVARERAFGRIDWAALALDATAPRRATPGDTSERGRATAA